MGFRSMRRDRTLLEHRIKKGTLPRVLQFARPYRVILGIFLAAVVLDAVVSSVSPLVLRAIIDIGHQPPPRGADHRAGVPDGGPGRGRRRASLVERRISSVIGEGLIYDLRARVYKHIQRMPIAFFSRTQTGALISRLNNDVIGAQQAFTDLFSNVVGNVILVAIILGHNVHPELADHPGGAGAGAGRSSSRRASWGAGSGRSSSAAWNSTPR